jgi:DNA-binding SARP family transcriptional activator/GTPase SAR1 family protein
LHTLEIKVLQTPKILLDSKEIIFPYKKAEAMLLYVALEKTASREVISTLLWEDADNETAKKNLRHALYITKKVSGFDVIISPQKFSLSLHPDIRLECDLDTFIKTSDINLYTAEFMQGFSLKNTNAFEEWLGRKRENLREIYLIKLYKHITSYQSDHLSEIELYCSKYVDADPFDERVIRYLMEAYQKNKLYLKGIKAYQKLHKQLGSELGIVPGQDITDLYKKLRMEWAESASREEPEEAPLIHGRKNEFAALKYLYNSFIDGSVVSVMLSGENGVGKTHLINSFLESIKEDNILLLTTACYSLEEKVPLYPWNSIILQLDEFLQKNKYEIPQAYSQAVAQYFPTFGNHVIQSLVSIDIANHFNFRAVCNGILRIINQITENTNILIIFDNFHLADTLSTQLIFTLLKELKQNFMIIFTCLDTLDDSMKDFTGTLLKNNMLSELKLHRFSREDVREIIDETLGKHDFDKKIIDTIYSETAGNAFFLNEILNTYKERGTITGLSLDAQNILNERLSGLSNEARQILDIISLFEGNVSLEVLEQVFNKSSLVMLDNIEELKRRSLIKEKLVHGQIIFLFTHNRMKEFVHSRLSPSKQKLLHNSIAYALELVLPKTENNYYNHILYHFNLANNIVKVLTYQILALMDSTASQLELYPSLIHWEENMNLNSNDSITAYFQSLENSLEQVNLQFQDSDLYQNLKTKLLIAKGRYFILSGNYSNGLTTIKKVYNMPYALLNPSYMLSAIRQTVYYGIQLYQTDIMNEYITKGLELARQHDIRMEYAIFLRLDGLKYLMLGDFLAGKANLLHSIEILDLQTHDSLSVINITAAYNYLGEMERRQLNFEAAIAYYKTAISLCTEHNTSISATFFTNMGCAYMGMGNKKEAFYNFLCASEIYENSKTLMGRSVAKGYCAVYYSEAGDFDTARQFLDEAEKAANQLGSPLEKGLLRRTQAELLYRFKKDYEEVLAEGLDFYIEDCNRLLKPLRNIYEIKDLEPFRAKPH